MPKITKKEDFAQYAAGIFKLIMSIEKQEDAPSAVHELREEWGIIIHSTNLLENIGIDAFLLEVEDCPRLCGVMSRQGIVVLDASNDKNSDILPFVEALKQLHRHSEAIKMLQLTFKTLTPHIDALDVSFEPKGEDYGPN